MARTSRGGRHPESILRKSSNLYFLTNETPAEAEEAAAYDLIESVYEDRAFELPDAAGLILRAGLDINVIDRMARKGSIERVHPVPGGFPK